MLILSVGIKVLIGQSYSLSEQGSLFLRGTKVTAFVSSKGRDT